MDFLSKTLGSFTGPSFPYTTGEKIVDSQDPNFPGIWNIHNGTVKVCVFCLKFNYLLEIYIWKKSFYYIFLIFIVFLLI